MLARQRDSHPVPRVYVRWRTAAGVDRSQVAKRSGGVRDGRRGEGEGGGRSLGSPWETRRGQQPEDNSRDLPAGHRHGVRGRVPAVVRGVLGDLCDGAGGPSKADGFSQQKFRTMVKIENVPPVYLSQVIYIAFKRQKGAGRR